MSPLDQPPVPSRAPQAARRDTHLRLVRRVRLGVVSAGVLGSLGVAGAVAASPHPATAPSPAVDQQDEPRTQQSQQHAGHAPGLHQGFGQAHGSTSGS